MPRGEGDSVPSPGFAFAVPVDVLAKSLEDTETVGVVMRAAVDIRIAFAHRVAPPELERVDPHLACDHVDVRFEPEEGLDVARRSNEAARDGIRVDRHPLDPSVGDVVGRLRIHPGDQMRDDLTRGVCAAVEDDADVERDDLPVLGDAGPTRGCRRLPEVGHPNAYPIGAPGPERACCPRRRITPWRIASAGAVLNVPAADEADLP